jgi:hypothetical protein
LDKSALPVTDGFFLFYPSRRQNPAALRALIDFLRSDLRAGARPARRTAEAQSAADAESAQSAARPTNTPQALNGNAR